jgi:hypothetical protein
MIPTPRLLSTRVSLSQSLLGLWRACLTSWSTGACLIVGEATFVMGWLLLWATGLDLVTFVPIWASCLLMGYGLLSIPVQKARNFRENRAGHDGNPSVSPCLASLCSDIAQQAQ